MRADLLIYRRGGSLTGWRLHLPRSSGRVERITQRSHIGFVLCQGGACGIALPDALRNLFAKFITIPCQGGDLMDQGAFSGNATDARHCALDQV
jgi:hypothetical protein